MTKKQKVAGLENIHPPRFSVAIIGGGFTGTTLAAQLRRRVQPSCSIVVVERASLPGRGVAYGTQSPAHLLNVPSKKMSAFADDAEHFLDWARSNYDPAVEASDFLPRRVYGQYIGSVFAQAGGAGDESCLRWKNDEARALSPRPDGTFAIELGSAGILLADRVVLALGNFAVSDPWLPGRDENNSRCYFRDPWSAASFHGVSRLGGILLLGSGLTSLDVALELRLRGFRGTLHMLSRHGLTPHSHRTVDAWPYPCQQGPPQNVLGWLRLIREQTREAQRRGLDWRAVVDSLRPHTPQIWQSWPSREKRRFLRHGKAYWEVHRHRAAPEIARFITEQIAGGQIQVHAGRVKHYQEKRAVRITFQKRNSSQQGHLRVDRVINCTGPETDCRRFQDPLITSLLLQGIARPDPLLLGLDVSRDGALMSRDGTTSESLYAVGPLRRGRLWESTAVPEIREQVRDLVEHLAGANERPAPLSSPAGALIASAALDRPRTRGA